MRPWWQSILVILCAMLLAALFIGVCQTRPVLFAVAFCVYFGKFLIGIGVGFLSFRLLQRRQYPTWASVTAAIVLCVGACGFIQGVSESHALVRIIQSIPVRDDDN